MELFLSQLNKTPSSFHEEDVFMSVWNQYERVVLESLLTAFWLDFMIDDIHGGDVDTVHNVNQIDIDPLMSYKNSSNETAYANREKYSHKNVEGPGTNYQRIKHEARRSYDSNNTNTVPDAYEGGKSLHFLGKGAGRPTDKNANLDHVIPAKTIHDNRGRVLAGISTKDLADAKSNLAWTNEHLNKSLGDTSKAEYINQHPDLTQTTKHNMQALEETAKSEMDLKIFQEYYLNPSNPQCRNFYTDTLNAAEKRGVEIGIRQALGFVFVEVWLVAKQEVNTLNPGCSFDEILKTMANGIDKGFKSALSKYDEILARFGEGMIAGSLSSLSITLCNVFFTTSKQFIKYVREITASVIRSSIVLLLNPDDLDLGDRIKMSTVILATGACILVGSAVGGVIAETPIATIPVIGDVIIRFCSSLVSGLLSCSLLIYMDRSEFINSLVDRLNEIPSEVTGMNELIDCLESYAAELSKIDITQFKQDSEQFQKSVDYIVAANDSKQLNSALRGIYKYYNLPWQGDFDSFMSSKNNHLVFD